MTQSYDLPAPADLAADLAGDGPLDPLDVLAALETAVGVAEQYAGQGGGTPTDRLRLFAAVADLRRRLQAVADEVEMATVADLPEPVEVDGRWWRAKQKPHRRGWDKDGLRSAVTRAALAERPDVDAETGEYHGDRPPTAEEAVATVWRAADVATGRTKVLREQFALDLDEYAETTWTTVLADDAPPPEPADPTSTTEGA